MSSLLPVVAADEEAACLRPSHLSQTCRGHSARSVPARYGGTGLCRRSPRGTASVTTSRDVAAGTALLHATVAVEAAVVAIVVNAVTVTACAVAAAFIHRTAVPGIKDSVLPGRLAATALP